MCHDVCETMGGSDRVHVGFINRVINALAVHKVMF